MKKETISGKYGTGFLFTVVFSFILVNVLAQNITGSGTIGKIPKFTNTNIIGNSIIWQSNGDTMIGIGMANRSDVGAKLHIVKSALNSTPVFQSNISGFGSGNSIKHIFSQDGKNYGLYQSGSSLLNYFAGSVGIGDENPLYLLTVNGGIGLKDILDFTGGDNGIISTSPNFTLAFRTSPTGQTSGALSISRTKTTIFDTLECDVVSIKHDAGLGKVLISDDQGNGIWTEATRMNDNDWLEGQSGSKNWTLPPSGATVLYLNPQYKKLGIGTDNPTQSLEISHSDTNGGIVINQLDTSLNKSEIKFSVAGVEKWAVGNQINPDRPNSFFIWNHGRSATEFFIGDNGMTGINTEWPNATLDVNGSLKADHVGIGTDAPAAIDSTWRLFVEGGIKAREILVTVDPFADYVFNEDYQLMSLNDLETFVKTNHHLPGIPSAAEVEEAGGIEIGAFQTKLLEKIEEQSLYIISLQKQIDEIKSMISSIKTSK